MTCAFRLIVLLMLTSAPIEGASAASLTSDASLADLASRSLPPTSLHLGEVAAGPVIPNAQSATDTRIMSRYPMVMRATVGGNGKVGYVLGCFYVPGAARETAPSAPCVYTGSFEYPAGTFQRMTCGGAPSCRVPAGEMVLTDLFATAAPPGEMFWSRLFMTNGEHIIQRVIGVNVANGAATAVGTSIADQTMGGDIVNNAGIAAPSSNAGDALTPLAIVGQTTVRSICLYGDSRTAGTGDTFDGGQNADIGQLARSIGPFAPYINLGVADDQAATYTLSHARRQALGAYCTDYIWAYGINDFTTDHAKASAVESYAALFKASVTGGVTLVTLDPVSRSSDEWTTPAAGITNNQRVVSEAIDANRVAYNEWCRRRAVGLGYKACLDIASTGEWGHNSGLWTTFDGRTLGNDLTIDGIHRNLLGYKLLQNSGLITPKVLK